MAGAFKFLSIADESPESVPAVLFAGMRAKATGGKLVILSVVEPQAQSDWISVGEEIRRQALESAQALAYGLAARVEAETGEAPELIIREGDLRKEIKNIVEEDMDIRFLVLGAGAGREGPGPLVASLARGHAFASRPLPIVVVPGAMSIEELRALL
jgi:nucleotide-binding universal stress UspA family protein